MIMSKKIEAAKLIADKLRGKSYLTYVEIANITSYHPKYILRLKKEILNNEIKLKHGNIIVNINKIRSDKNECTNSNT